MNVKIFIHHEKDDENCEFDALCYDVVVDDKIAKTYGDDYHDRGYDKAIGFCDGLKYQRDIVNILTTEVEATGKEC